MFVEEEELLLRYLKHADFAKSAKRPQTGIYISNIDDLTLSEFRKARELYCKAKNHDSKLENCNKSSPLLQIATEILKGFVRCRHSLEACLMLIINLIKQSED